MKFAQWLSLTESGLRDIIKPVPQNPKHHAEGDVFTHTRLVRQQLNDAIAHFQQLVKTDPVFSNFDPAFSKEDINLLRIGSWMHDIGKAKATEIDGQPWQNTETKPDSKITAYAHEMPHMFEPMMKKLNNPWQQMYANASEVDKQDLWFMIRYHMDLKQGFSKGLLSQILENGKFKNERRIKLLLVLILMDKTGRFKLGGIRDNIADVSQKMGASVQDYTSKLRPQRVKTEMTPDEFYQSLKTKGMPEEQIQDIMKRKYGG